MLNITVDTRELQAAMAEFAREARKDLDKIIREQAGLLTGHMIALTPPAAGRGQAMNDRGRISLEAKKRGEAAVAADIAALFPTTRLRESAVMGMIDAGFEWGSGRGKKVIRDFAPTEADLARIHRASRGSFGRVRLGYTGGNMALTRAATRRAYTRAMQRRVGLLNAGWLNAARELRTARSATPAWITRHQPGPGGIALSRTPTGLQIRIANRLPWFPRDMESRVERAVRWRTKGLRKALQSMVERRSRRANQRMGR